MTLAHASGIIMTSAYSAAMGAARSMAPSVVYQTAYCVALAVPEMASRVFLQVSLEKWYEAVETPRNRSTLWMSSRTPSPKRTFLTFVRLSIWAFQGWGDGQAVGEHTCVSGRWGAHLIWQETLVISGWGVAKLGGARVGAWVGVGCIRGHVPRSAPAGAGTRTRCRSMTSRRRRWRRLARWRTRR